MGPWGAVRAIRRVNNPIPPTTSHAPGLLRRPRRRRYESDRWVISPTRLRQFAQFLGHNPYAGRQIVDTSATKKAPLPVGKGASLVARWGVYGVAFCWYSLVGPGFMNALLWSWQSMQ